MDAVGRWHFTVPGLPESWREHGLTGDGSSETPPVCGPQEGHCGWKHIKMLGCKRCSHSGKVWRFLKKLRKLPYDTSNPSTRHISRQNYNSKRYMQPSDHSSTIHNNQDVEAMDEWIKMWHIYTMEYYLAIKEGNLTICNSLNGPRGYYAKWNKSDRERQILCDLTRGILKQKYKKLPNSEIQKTE